MSDPSARDLWRKALDAVGEAQRVIDAEDDPAAQLAVANLALAKAQLAQAAAVLESVEAAIFLAGHTRSLTEKISDLTTVIVQTGRGPGSPTTR